MAMDGDTFGMRLHGYSRLCRYVLIAASFLAVGMGTANANSKGQVVPSQCRVEVTNRADLAKSFVCDDFRFANLAELDFQRFEFKLKNSETLLKLTLFPSQPSDGGVLAYGLYQDAETEVDLVGSAKCQQTERSTRCAFWSASGVTSAAEVTY